MTTISKALFLLAGIAPACVSQTSFSPCDVNQLGTVTIVDAQAMIDQALGIAPAASDLNRDGVIDIADVQFVIDAALGLGCPAVVGGGGSPGGGLPAITSVSPLGGLANQTTTVALTGTHFIGSVFSIAGGTVIGALVTGDSDATLQILSQTPGDYAIVATNAYGSSSAIASAANQFLVISDLAPPPTISSLSPGSAKSNTTVTVTVTGQSLLAATFAFQNPIPGLTAVPGPITVVSNDGSTAVLNFPTGSAQNQYTLIATTPVGTSPSSAGPQFIVLPGGTYTLGSAVLSLLNTALSPLTNSHGAMGSAQISVLNTALPPLTSVYSVMGSAQISVLNTALSPLSNPHGTMGSGQISVLNTALSPPGNPHGTMGSGQISVLNVALPPLSSVYTVMGSPLVTVLNAIAPTFARGANSFGSLSVSVCNVASGCTAQVQTVPLPPAPRTASAMPASIGPRLEPVDSLDSIVPGRSILLTAEWVKPGDNAAVDFEVNGSIVGSVRGVPYDMLFTVPAGVQNLVFRAVVTLPSGAVASSRQVRMPVVSDGGAPVKLPRMKAGETATLFAGGLKAEYFAFPQPQAAIPPLDGLTPRNTSFVTAVNQPNPGAIFGDDPLGAGLPGDFAARFSGELWAEGGGEYNFWLTARNAAELRVDSKTVAAAGISMGSPAESAGSATLSPGWHKIEIRYLRAVGMESVRLEWEQPGAPRQVVSPQYFRIPLEGVSVDNVPAMFDSVWVRLQQATGTREILLRTVQ